MSERAPSPAMNVVDITFDAPIARVTVLEDRAMVTRSGPVPPITGQLRLIIPHVSPVLTDKSLRATAPAGTRVLDVRCVRSMAPWRAGTGAGAGSGPGIDVEGHAAHGDAVALTAAVERARLQLEQARSGDAAARAELAAHGELRRAELADLAAAAARGEVSREAAAELAARDDEARAAVERIAEAEEQVVAREQALRDAEALAALAGLRAGVETARLEIDCIVERVEHGEHGERPDQASPQANDLTVEYLVPAAAWRPFHRAHLIHDDAADALSWEQGAVIWQRTGEDWTGVSLSLSAERASLGVEPPEIEDDLLDVRAKPSSVAVQAREQEIEQVGLGDAGPSPGGGSEGGGGGGETMVMGIDDGGLGLLLSPSGPCSIRSDGRPHRVALETFRSEVETALLVIPLRSPLCHVRTRFANRARTPILSGPVDLVRRSGFIGRTDIDFVNAGEKAELGFGSEPEVRVHREQHEEQEESSLLGGWTSKVVRVVIRLSNLGATARQIVVSDRVPVSEIEQVVITVAGPEAYLLEKEQKHGQKNDKRTGEEAIPQITARTIDPNGLVTWNVPLPPRGRAAVTLEYKVKSQRGVTGI